MKRPVHPGEILKEEFLKPGKISQKHLANSLNVSVQRINEIVNCKRGITPETALLLADYFNTSPEFWMNLQSSYDLSKAREKIKKLIK